jgi:YfiH family protein
MTSNNTHILPDWPAPKNIHALTTLRTGGVSTGLYSSLNPATHVGDDPDLVVQNRTIIRETLALPAEPVWLQQIHSNTVVDAAKVEALPQADASYSHAANVLCTVMTADCLPLLVCSGDGACVAAVHAGWRGLLDGVITNTILAMQSGNLLVWLGPAIGPACFEVGTEVRGAFVKKSAAFASAFTQQGDRWLADIYQMARVELSFLAIDKIYGGDFCTVTEHERFYSYRRDKETGRMASLIWRT